MAGTVAHPLHVTIRAMGDVLWLRATDAVSLLAEAMDLSSRKQNGEVGHITGRIRRYL
jgi:2'-5' RNA ligase